MPYDPRELEDAKKKQREATGNVYGAGSGLLGTFDDTGDTGDTGVFDDTGDTGTFDDSGDTGTFEDTEAGDTGDTARWSKVAPHAVNLVGEPDWATFDAGSIRDWMEYLRRSTNIKVPSSAAATAETAPTPAPTAEATAEATADATADAAETVAATEQSTTDVDQVSEEAPRSQAASKSASANAPNYAETWNIEGIWAPVGESGINAKTITARMNIGGRSKSVKVGTRFSNGDKITGIERAPMRVGQEEGQTTKVWRLRITPAQDKQWPDAPLETLADRESPAAPDYFIYPKDVDASQIVEGDEAAASRASKKEAARKKTEAAWQEIDQAAKEI